jgi:hypothetical protein
MLIAAALPLAIAGTAHADGGAMPRAAAPSTIGTAVAAPDEKPPEPAPAPSTVKLTIESTPIAKDGPAAKEPAANPDDYKLLHGFRIGYGYIMNYDQPVKTLDGQSLKDSVGLRTPSHFLLGYEVVYRVVGHSWLNVLLMANGMIAGLEQSKILPTANFLIGAELNNSFQIGVGASLSPLKGEEAHTIIAAGWTPKVGTIYTPVHLFFVPDVDGVHRMGITTGVTF